MRHAILSSVVTAVALGLVLALGSSVRAEDPAVKCEENKLKESGKYSKCRLKAEAKGVKKAEQADYTKCEEKFGEKWDKVEGKAEGACPTNGDVDSMDARITTDAAEIATLLAGGTLAECGDGSINVAWEQCDGADLGGETCTGLRFVGGTLACDVTCGFDTSGCVVGTCGDGVVNQPSEQCDGTDLNGVLCEQFGLLGDPGCDSSCEIDGSQCFACPGGTVVGDSCWYLAPVGDNCNDVCGAVQLSYDDVTRTFAGSSGTTANCQSVLLALGLTSLGTLDTSCDLGRGCTYSVFAERGFRCTSPATVAEPPSVNEGNLRVCACQ